MSGLAALVPSPCVNLTRFHGVFAQGGLSAPAFRQAICLPEPMEEGRIERSCWNLPAGIGLAGAHRARQETGCDAEKSTLRGVIGEVAEGREVTKEICRCHAGWSGQGKVPFVLTIPYTIGPTPCRIF